MEHTDMESRQAAGRALAAPLQPYASPGVLVVGVSQGGILVGLEVAQALGAAFEPLAIQTLPDPGRSDHTIGVLVEPEYVDVHGAGELPPPLHGAVTDGLEDVRRRGALYRNGQPLQNVEGRRVIVVSDAVSTGTTLRGVVGALRQRGAGEIVVAVPVGPPNVLASLETQADVVVHLQTPAHLIAGQGHYPLPRVLDDDELARRVQAAGVSVPPDSEAPQTVQRPSL